jgi:tRNA 5-methylaminomethyl-2-thiouridine biosynthesis bifunctional protein
MKDLSLKKAAIEWRNGSVPVAIDFDDIYFSTEDGLAESRHVFLEGVGGPDIWQGVDHFVIGETGFGTGLNFLTTWQAWRETASNNQRLTFVSVEAFPLSIEQLTRAHSSWPELSGLSVVLCDAYPDLQPGFHSVSLDFGRVQLLLLFGPASKLLPELKMEANAWYLDGFAPQKNPDLWNEVLFEQVARCSAKNCRVATFTVAAQVKRELDASGYEIEKRPGFSKKRECLSGQFKGRRVRSNKPKSVAVIGSGIAGASAAYALKKLGAEPTVFERGSSIACETSGNPVAIFEPRMNRNQDEDGEFHVAAYFHALRLYSALNAENEVWVGPRGLEKRPTNSELRKRFAEWVDMKLIPDDHMKLLESGALWFPKAGAVSPKTICEGLLTDIDIQLNCPINDFEWRDGKWKLSNSSNEDLGSFDAVVLAGGINSLDLVERSDYQVNAKRGQLTYVSNNGCEDISNPVSFGSYLAGTEDFGVVGATYRKLDDWNNGEWRNLSESDHQENMSALIAEMPDYHFSDAIGGRAAVRATTVDRVPVVGADPDRPNLWLAFGFGSRGFLTAPLAGAALASEILGTPNPLPMSFWAALSPERFKLRKQRREG